MRNDYLLAVLFVAIIALMIVPIPTFLIDIFLVCNIALSVLLMVNVIYLKKASDFSIFPSVILIGTVLRLALSVSTTRLILIQADAGAVIETFGQFVVGGSIVVGLVIFLIITSVQFVVVTRGAERIAEVAARFALDAMPGKQMTIDAQVRAGTLDLDKAQEMRESLDHDNQFFGAMDGAMKFVKGDAIAGLIIITVNLIGGIAVGTLSLVYSLTEAMSIYSLLTVGDGLVMQIPALFMAMTAGALITRVSGDNTGNLGSEIVSQITKQARSLGIAGLVIMGLGLIPGFPMLTCFSVAAFLIFLALNTTRTAKKSLDELSDRSPQTSQLPAETSSAPPSVPPEEENRPPTESFETSRMTLYLGKGLHETALSSGIEETRNACYEQWTEIYGVTIPRYSIAKDNTLNPWGARFDFDTVPAGSFTVPENHSLCVADKEIIEALDCEKIEPQKKWPGEAGSWIPRSAIDDAVKLGAAISSPGEAVAVAAFRLAERFASQIITGAEVEKYFNQVKTSELASSQVDSLNQAYDIEKLTEIFRRMLADNVPLKPPSLIVQSLLSASGNSDRFDLVIDRLRESLKRQICHSHAGEDGILPAIIFDPAIDQRIRNIIKAHKGVNLTLAHITNIDPELTKILVQNVGRYGQKKSDLGNSPIVVTSPDIRLQVRSILLSQGINLPVLSHNELAEDVSIQPVRVVQKRTRPRIQKKPARVLKSRNQEEKKHIENSAA